MSKKMILRLISIATKATQNANTEFAGMGEIEATTLVGMAVRKELVGLVASAAGCDPETAKAAIAAATVEVDEALAAKKAKKNGTDNDE